jgi:small subunit ribosomal protein S10
MTIQLILESFDNKLFNITLKELNNIFNIKSIISLPTKIKKFCVLRSPHIDKNSREHFEIRFYKKLINLKYNKFNFNFYKKLLLNFNFSTGISCKLKFL